MPNPCRRWEKKNNDYVGCGKGTGLQVNVKFRGSERFPAEKMMRPIKILDKRKRGMVFPSTRSSRCSARGAVKGKRLHSPVTLKLENWGRDAGAACGFFLSPARAFAESAVVRLLFLRGQG
jgi:hypothetical protein